MAIEEEIMNYKGDDIKQPICDVEQMKRLAAKGEFPTPFISNITIGWGLIRKTDKMKKATLKTQCSIGYGKCYNVTHPEKVITDIVLDYCNRFPFPEMLFNRIKKDLEVNVKFKKEEKKNAESKT